MTPSEPAPEPAGEPATGSVDGSAIAAEILRQTQASGPARSICPSAVARALAPDPAWRGLMGPVRAAAADLARAGRIDILRKGKPIAPEAMHGVIRLRLRPTPAPTLIRTLTPMGPD